MHIFQSPYRKANPQKSLFIHVTKDKEPAIFVLLTIVYLIPMALSFVMYSLLFWEVKYSKRNSVGVMAENSIGKKL